MNVYKIENGNVVQIEQKLTPGKSVAVGDKRKLEDAEQEKIKKTVFKGLEPADFNELAAYYATLK